MIVHDDDDDQCRRAVVVTVKRVAKNGEKW
jgi:hypothetical protein